MADVKDGVLDKAVRILREGYLCDRCLGRQFSQLLTGISNEQRGRAIRMVLAMLIDAGAPIDVNPTNFYPFRLRSAEMKKLKKAPMCILCRNVFEDIGEWIKKVKKAVRRFEFDSFLVGTKLPRGFVAREEALWEEIGIDFCEPLKAEINRLVGKTLERELGKPVRTRNPDMTIVLNMRKNEVEILPASLYIFGFYKKFARIPQTRWPTTKYKTSVEEIIARPVIRASKGVKEKFHAAGREEVDARCLDWRPFVVEILNPSKRRIDLKSVMKKINRAKGVMVRSLKVIDKSTMKKIKDLRPDKSYRILLSIPKKIDKTKLGLLRNILGTIRQRTPNRLLLRRPEKEKRRKVKEIRWRIKRKVKTRGMCVELKLRVEAGTYVPELITGDNRRTRPSIAEVLGYDIRSSDILEIDVIKIHHGLKSKII